MRLRNRLRRLSAGQIVIDTSQAVDGGLASDRWAEIVGFSHETVVPGIHVVGDSSAACQPRAGHIADQ
ncbi:MAG: hypothetical protein Kow0013_15990 [Pararhodobacter sp.]